MTQATKLIVRLEKTQTTTEIISVIRLKLILQSESESSFCAQCSFMRTAKTLTSLGFWTEAHADLSLSWVHTSLC